MGTTTVSHASFSLGAQSMHAHGPCTGAVITTARRKHSAGRVRAPGGRGEKEPTEEDRRVGLAGDLHTVWCRLALALGRGSFLG